jgi:glycosyltransferase involved in cell wall biosynthesis
MSVAAAPAERLLFVDATGTLLSYGSAPSGIPRVEDFLVRAAIAEGDPAVLVVKLDRRREAYVGLDVFERQQLGNEIDLDPVKDRRGRVLNTRQRAFRIIRQYPTIGRDADRHFADIATNNRRRGFFYQATKLQIRLYRWYRRCLAELNIAWSGGGSQRVDLTRGTILLSNTAVLGSSLSRTLDGTQERAFICHDLIPLLYPRFAISAGATRRFTASIDQIMALENTTALCTSETSLLMMTEYAHGARAKAARIMRFSLPSILLEKAVRLPDPGGDPAGEPYILYCSTIEVRKNHLLLARVWQQAMDDNVALPKLLCVGKWGWGVDELSDFLAAHPGLSSRIVFTGPASDTELIRYYRHALFGVMPSHVEGWGYGASECLDFGIPVIVSTAPALREATRGLMPAIDPDDQAGWYDAIRRLSESGELRTRYRQLIAERYRSTSTAESWMQIKSALLKHSIRRES